jgi:hypothetical protein
MRTRSTKLLLTSLCSLAACVTGGGGGGGGPSNNVDDSGVTITSIAQYFSVIETQDCGEIFNCASSYQSSGSGDTVQSNYGATVADCVAMEDANIYMTSLYVAEVMAGRATFDAMAATQCVQQTVEPMACSDYWNNGPTQPSQCFSIFNGTVADGAACQDDVDCSDSASFCDNGTCDMGSAGSGSDMGSGSGSAGIPD